MILSINISITPLLLSLFFGVFGILLIFIVYLLIKNKKEKHNNALKIDEILAYNTTLSHELRTPLHAVTSISKSLLDNAPEASQIEDLQILERASNYLVKLINDSLLLKKIDAKKLSPHQEAFDLDGLVYQVSKTVEKQIATKGTEIEINIDLEIPNHLNGDPVKLTQILINLLNNAVKFGEKKPVMLRLEGSKITNKSCEISFKVLDQGKGIPKGDQGKILKHFHQLESKNKELKGLVEQLKEKLEVQKEEMEKLIDRNKILRIAGGSKEGDQREIKLKINEIVREVDKCIAQLNY